MKLFIDEDDYMKYVDYIKDYQVKFDSTKPAIPVLYKIHKTHFNSYVKIESYDSEVRSN